MESTSGISGILIGDGQLWQGSNLTFLSHLQEGNFLMSCAIVINQVVHSFRSGHLRLQHNLQCLVCIAFRSVNEKFDLTYN